MRFRLYCSIYNYLMMVIYFHSHVRLVEGTTVQTGQDLSQCVYDLRPCFHLEVFSINPDGAPADTLGLKLSVSII